MEYYVVCCNYKNKNVHAGGPCLMLSLRRDTVIFNKSKTNVDTVVSSLFEFDYSCVDSVPYYFTVQVSGGTYELPYI
jgi:hypothetical protein